MSAVTPVPAPAPSAEAIAAARSQSNSRRALRWTTIISIAVMVGAFVFLGRKLFADWESVRSVPWSFEPARLILSFALLGVYYALLVWIWCLLMRQLGQAVSFRTALPIWLGPQLGKYIPGKVWSTIGRLVLAERAGLDSIRVSVSLVIEVAIILVSGLLVAAGAIAFAGDVVIPGKPLIIGMIPVGLAVVHPRFFLPLVHWVMRRLHRPDIEFQWSAWEQYRLVLLYVVSWILYGGAFYALIDSLHIPIGHSANTTGAFLATLMFVLGANALAWTIGFLAFLTPGGLGVREASLAFFLKQLMPAAVATLVALMARVWVTVAEIVIVGAGWWIGHAAMRRAQATATAAREAAR
ncbi:MAG: lysylphosphatidylglycerol synthase domain-containing protein [bacterium]